MVPTAAEWCSHLEKPPVQGGLALQRLDPEEYKEEILKIKKDMRHEFLLLGRESDKKAKDIYFGMRRYLRRATKRKSFPSWGLPAEAMLMAMSPGPPKGVLHSEGVGYNAKKDSVLFYVKMTEVLELCWVTRWPVVDWLRAAA